MSTGHKGTNVLNIFRWKLGSEPSLTTGLLNDVSTAAEVELSDIRRIPSPGSESPSALLNDESPKVEPIADLDLFFERLYSYYCEKGLWCIIVKWVVELLSLAFTICFSGFFLLFVDWNGLRNAKCGMDAVESGIRPCDLAKEALHRHPLSPLTLHKAVILGYLGIFSIYWIFCFLRFFAQLRYTLRIRHFYRDRLQLTDNELQTIPWASVLEKVIEFQKTEKLCVVKELSSLEIVMRLMRKENYLIGMINKGVLAFPISKWIPGAGLSVRCQSNAGEQRLILTKTLEWTLNWSILQSMFDRNFCIRSDFICNPDSLKKRLMVVGLVMLLLSPFLVIFMLVYLFLRHAEQFYNHPTTAISRRWSNLSRWIFREFNEVDHLFRHRINSSAVHASDYLKQFPSPIISIVAKFISFIAGGFAAVLIILAFLDESLLEGHIFGRNLFWYAAVFGAITAFSRAAVINDVLVLDPERAMSLVVESTHYMPKKWRGKENTEMVRNEFETLYQYTAMMWLEEMASIFLTPYLLVFVVPKRVDDILKFIQDFSVNIEGVGDVCSFSAFDFQKHGNFNYGSPVNASRTKRSSQGKMEKSFLSFQSTYLSWKPDEQGLQFLMTLRTFRDQRLQAPPTRNPWPRSSGFQFGPNLRENHLYNKNSHFPGDHDRPRTPHHMGSLWLIEPGPRSQQPYLLDWYYTSRPHRVTTSGHSPDVSEVCIDIPPFQQDEHSGGEIWMPRFSREPGKDVDCGNIFGERSQSHLGASTSGSFFKEQSDLPLQPTDAVHRSPWWARAGTHGGEDPTAQTSFLEPPDFNFDNRHMVPIGDNCYDSKHSNRSFLEAQENDDEEHGLQVDWNHWLSRTTYPDDFGGGGEQFKLHFDDIYRPPDL